MRERERHKERERERERRGWCCHHRSCATITCSRAKPTQSEKPQTNTCLHTHTHTGDKRNTPITWSTHKDSHITHIYEHKTSLHTCIEYIFQRVKFTHTQRHKPTNVMCGCNWRLPTTYKKSEQPKTTADRFCKMLQLMLKRYIISHVKGGSPDSAAEARLPTDSTRCIYKAHLEKHALVKNDSRVCKTVIHSISPQTIFIKI